MYHREASTSTYVQRVLAEQAAVESRLVELDGVEAINTGLKRTVIKGEDDMNIDIPREPPTSRTLEAKRKALSRFVEFFRPKLSTSTTQSCLSQTNSNHESGTLGSLSMQEAMELERQAFLQDKERQNRIEEKKKRLGKPIKGEVLTRQEREARIWAFMYFLFSLCIMSTYAYDSLPRNHKPTESDLEDDSDADDEEDDDPATWFEDDQDDGRKGQDIIEPDVEDFSDILRIDKSRIHYNTFDQPDW